MKFVDIHIKLMTPIRTVIALSLMVGFGTTFADSTDELSTPRTYEMYRAEWLTRGQELVPDSANGRTAVLLHGFGGSPFDLEPLARRMLERGFRVVVPLIPGQIDAESVQQRNQITADSLLIWLRDVVAGETPESEAKPVIIGFSMGGTLASIAAGEGRAGELVLLAPYFGLPHFDDATENLTEFVGRFVQSVPKLDKGRIADTSGYGRYIPGAREVPLGMFQVLQQLVDIASDAATGIDVRTLVIHSSNDPVASHASMADVFRDNDNAEILTLHESQHILLYDSDSTTVINTVFDFLSR
jgi:carboxylesterase